MNHELMEEIYLKKLMKRSIFQAPKKGCHPKNGGTQQLVGGFNPFGNLPQVGVKIKNLWNHQTRQLLVFRI